MTSKYTVSNAKAKAYMQKYGLSEQEFTHADNLFKKFSKNGLFNFESFNQINQKELSKKFSDDVELEFTTTKSGAAWLDFDDFIPVFKVFYKYV